MLGGTAVVVELMDYANKILIIKIAHIERIKITIMCRLLDRLRNEERDTKENKLAIKHRREIGFAWG